MEFAFRVDASDAIGTGHLMRCLTLADALAAAGHACRFIMRALPGNLADLPVSRGHGVATLPAPGPEEPCDGDLVHSAWLGVTRKRDAAETSAALGAKVDWLVTDSYAIEAGWQTALRDRARRILAIDDLADRPFDCDILLDQNLQAAPDRYVGLIPDHCTTLIGPKFALLRPEFAAQRAAPSVREPDRILIGFGGIDAPGATLLALEALALAKMDRRPVDIVAGPRNPHLPAIQAWCAARPNAALHWNADLAGLMARAGLAIGAAGATAWERCCLGLPTILVTIADNQKPGAEALARANAALWAGDVSDLTVADLAAMLRTIDRAAILQDIIATHSKAICDGKGAIRVVNAIAASEILIRPAEYDDCDAIWRWRNHPDTRRHSLDSKEVDLNTHRDWYAKALADPRRNLLIGEMAGLPVGVLRFDVAESAALTSIYLVPEWTGRSIGPALLRRGIEWLRHNRPGVRVVDAEILGSNIASLHAFRQVGFVTSKYEVKLPLPGASSARQTP